MDRILTFQKENVFNSTQIGLFNSILAAESQYATQCVLQSEKKDILVVASLITPPISASLFSGAIKVRASSHHFITLLVMAFMIKLYRKVV